MRPVFIKARVPRNDRYSPPPLEKTLGQPALKATPTETVLAFGGKVRGIAEGGAKWVYFRPLGSVLVATLVGLVAVIPIAHEYKLLENRKWLWFWLALFVVEYIRQAASKGKARDRENAQVHASARERGRKHRLARSEDDGFP